MGLEHSCHVTDWFRFQSCSFAREPVSDLDIPSDFGNNVFFFFSVVIVFAFCFM